METSSSESAKLFVGGLDWKAAEAEIGGYFAKFGEVKEVVVVRDRATGNSKGFGFVEFLGPESADKAFVEKDHVIGEKKVDVKRARRRGEQCRNYQFHQNQNSIISGPDHRLLSNNAARDYCSNGNHLRLKKVFVGGLSSNITENDFRTYFEKFGKITDVVIMYDSLTHRPRGFGFVTFDSMEAVDNVLKEKFHQVNNKNVEVKVAIPKDSNNQPNFRDSNVSSDDGIPVNHQHAYYSPRHGLYPGYVPPIFPGYYYGTPGYSYGYSTVPYSGFSYGTPYIPRSPWNGPGMVGVMQSSVHYSNTAMHSDHLNAVMIGGYNKFSETDDAIRITDHSMGTEDIGKENLEIQQAS